MAKLFGEFLIDKGLATTEQVLKAVIAQLRSAPSTAEVIFDHNLLPPTDQLRILAHQQYAGADFRTSAGTLGLWSAELAAKVSDLVRAKRRPIGEVLVQLGFLSIDALTRALDSYVEATSAPHQAAPHQAATPKKVPDAAFDPVLTREFVENYETLVYPALHAVLDICDSKRQTNGELLTSALRAALLQCVALRAAAVFLSATRTTELADELVGTLETALDATNSTKSMTLDTSVLRDIFKIAIHVFGCICQLLQELGSEDGMATDPNLIDLTERLEKAQVRLRAQCSGKPRVA